MEAAYLPRVHGPALYYRKWPSRNLGRPGARGKAVFLGHSQATHSGMVASLAEGFRASGWNVHSGDIRGHGRSTDSNLAPGHLDPTDGWKLAVEDMHHLLERSFAGTSWADRMVVMPSISALLTLEVMKSWPDLARQIVLISPPPNQKTLALFGKAFAEVRMRLRNPADPDEQSLHHLYAFLGAHLKDRKHLADVMSADRSIVQGVIEDPYGWPTPTPAYWANIFSGMLSAWKWPRGSHVTPGTRCLILFGGEDGTLQDGGFLPPIERFLNGIGIEEVASERIAGARSALFLEEERFSVSRHILDWSEKKRHPAANHREVDVEQLASDVLTRISETGTRTLKPDELVDLCYNAIEDDSRWTEIIYRMIYEAQQLGDAAEDELEERLGRLMPHWERAFNLNKQVMMSATLGVLLQSVIEKLQIGVAILDKEDELLHANPAYDENLARLCEDASAAGKDGNATSHARTRSLLNGQTAIEAQQEGSERVIIFEDKPVGFQFFPDALKQTGLQRQGPASILVLRTANAGEDMETRRSLLELAYGLTGKEAEIALMVAAGKNLNDIAAELGIFVSTVRGHLKKSFHKIGVRSQAELAARIMSGPVGWLK